MLLWRLYSRVISIFNMPLSAGHCRATGHTPNGLFDDGDTTPGLIGTMMWPQDVRRQAVFSVTSASPTGY